MTSPTVTAVSDVRYERTAHCLMLMMQAYERRVRSECKTPEDLAAEPWRCREFIAAEDALRKGWPAHNEALRARSALADVGECVHCNHDAHPMWGCKADECQCGFGEREGTGKQPLPSTVALADVVECEALVEELRNDFINIVVGGCTCGTKPPDPALHELNCHYRMAEAGLARIAVYRTGKQPRPAAEVRALTPTRLDTGSIFMLKNLAAANAREGITSSLMPADVYSLCAEVLALRRALEGIRCRSSELAKKTSVEIRNDLHGIHADAAEALVESPAAHTAQDEREAFDAGAILLANYASNLPSVHPWHKHAATLRRLAEQGSAT